jgi:hypothetical protein
MRIFPRPNKAVMGRSRRNEGTTGYEPKRVRANSMVNTRNQFSASLAALLLLTMIVVSSLLWDILLWDIHESITINDCESIITNPNVLVRSKHSCDSSLEQRFTTFNKCLSPNAKSRLCSDGHCSDYDHKLRPVLCRFYDDWYMASTQDRSDPAVLDNLELGPSKTSMSQIRICPSFFSLGRKELVHGLRFATTEVNPNLFRSVNFFKSFLISLMLSTNSQFDSLAKFYRIEYTHLPTLCKAIISLRHNFFT